MSDSKQKSKSDLARIMRRKGVGTDEAPSLERWQDFLSAVESRLGEYEKNRELLDKSVKTSSGQLKQLYEQLKTESNLRLVESERHQEELENDVRQRTADLHRAQLDLERINERLAYEATHDNLTGVFNRTYFIRVADQRFKSCIENFWNERFAIYYIDFDKFKQINDTLGHEAGDQLLIAFAERMQSVLAEGDCLARLGGDEFTLMTELKEGHDGTELAQKIKRMFEEPFKCRDLEISIQASIGIAVGGRNYESAEGLMRDADIAMYQAKETGETFVLFDQQMREKLLESLELERDLKVAITERQFVVNFEPIVNVKNQTVCSMESLARWKHPHKGTVTPSKFIPIAKECGLVVDIDRIVFEKTCEAFRRWQDETIVSASHKFSVNLASGQLERFDLLPFLLRTIVDKGIESSQVVLEIQESQLLDDSGQASQNIHDLSQLGFEILVDDFGTGYSSLSYLSKYPIDGIKVDRIFVRDAQSKPENRVLIRSIVAMAGALDMKVVIEGVETIEQLKLVSELGCHLVQGFVFTTPMREKQATKFLRDDGHISVLAELEHLNGLPIPCLSNDDGAGTTMGVQTDSTL